MFRGLETYGTGEHGCQYSPAVSPERQLPQNAPAVPTAMLVGPEHALVQSYAPMGIRVPAPIDAHTVHRIAPVRHGLLYISGVRSFNAPGEVEIVRITVGNGGDIPRNATPFDAAAYRTQACFCPVDWGCSNQIVITVRGLSPNARLNWVVFGTLMQSWNSCYVGAGTVQEHAAAMSAMVHGRDPYDHATLEQWRASNRTIPPRRVPVSLRPRSKSARSFSDRLRTLLAR